MKDDLSDDDIPEDETEEDEDEEEGSGGDDHAALTLETPESAAAIAAAMAGNKDGKKIGKKGKGKAGAKGVGVALDDAALGLDEGAEDDEPDAEEEEGASYQSSIDRDEITDPDPEDRIDPLAALLGGQDKPWENEKLSAAERMLLQEGYFRNDPNAGEDEEPDTDGVKKAARVAKAAAGIAAVAAVGAGLAGAKAVAATTNRATEGTNLAGVSRGPAHKVEDTPTPGARETRQQQEARTKEAARAATATTTTTTTARQQQDALQTLQQQDVQERQRRENERREADTRLQTEQQRTQEARVRAETASRQSSGPDMAEILLHHQILNNANARVAADLAGETVAGAAAGPVGGGDPDMVLRTALNRIYEALGLEKLVAGMGNDRLEGWAQQTEGLRENARDLTEPPAPAGPTPQDPAPELEQQKNMSINIGLGGP